MIIIKNQILQTKWSLPSVKNCPPPPPGGSEPNVGNHCDILERVSRMKFVKDAGVTYRKTMEPSLT